jgi:ABC-type polysaccharide/polyol phosphate export permease
MNAIKRLLGPFWMRLGPAAIVVLIYEAAKKIAEKPTQDVYLPWVIIITIFTPIAIGFVIFGYYAMKGEYDLPHGELYE